MGGIAERAEIGVVRRDDEHLTARADQSMKLFHAADDVRDVLDHVHSLQRVERRIAERVRDAIEIAQDVGAAGGIAIDTDRALPFVDPAADVECTQTLDCN